jgi:hypothetical protein
MKEYNAQMTVSVYYREYQDLLVHILTVKDSSNLVLSPEDQLEVISPILCKQIKGHRPVQTKLMGQWIVKVLRGASLTAEELVEALTVNYFDDYEVTRRFLLALELYTEVKPVRFASSR